MVRDGKMEKQRKKLAELEESLASEERVLENIRDSLKGMVNTMWTFMCGSLQLSCRQDAGIS